MICTLYRTIYEHLRYINMILNFLYIIQYIWYDTNNYKRNHDFWAQVLFTNALKVINLIVVNMWPVDCTYSLVSGDLSTYRASASVGGYSFVIQKLLHFTHFNKKYTHISECKVVHNYTNTTVTVHICMATVARVFTILIISSLSYIWLTSQLSLSHFITALSVSHLNSAKLISFSFFFNIPSFEDEDNDSSTDISWATNWVRSTSELGTLISLFDPPIHLEMETVTENWSDMEGKACYYLDRYSASFGAEGFFCGTEVLNSSTVEDRDDESRW